MNKNNMFSNISYYIKDNLKRYENYIKKNPDKELSDVIKLVNVNRDYDYYTHVLDNNILDGKLVLVNKYHCLKKEYIPKLVEMDIKYSHPNKYMDEEAYMHLKDLIDDAKSENIKIFNVSSYRSYDSQDKIYQNYLKKDGALADTYSARPGFSEHQTGLATDLNTIESIDHFENTREFAWLSKNAYKYGFILRYPKGKEEITGYKFEPWHYRYVGIDIAKKIYETDITYDEYYAYFIDQRK